MSSSLAVHVPVPANAPAKKPMHKSTIRRQCAVFFDGLEGSLIGGKNFGLSPAISTTLLASLSAGASPWIGLQFHFGLNPDNEDVGIGCVHILDRNAGDNGAPKPTDEHRLTVQFPRGRYNVLLRETPDEVRSRFPAPPKELTLLDIRLDDGARVDVVGFGIPFTAPDHPSIKTILGNEPIVGNVTLLDVIEQRNFLLAVDQRLDLVEKMMDESRLPPALSYPWGDDHTWEYDKYREIVLDNKGAGFRTCWTFDDDNMHVGVLCHAQAQDVIWLEEAAREIHANQMRGYFVPLDTDTDQPSRLYVIIAAPKDFRSRFEHAWKRLLSSEIFRVNLLTRSDEEKPAGWDAKLVEHPETVKSLEQHPVAPHEMVLYVRRPKENSRGRDFDVATFCDRATANAALEESPKI